MENDVFDHDDGVVDDEADGCGHAAESHEVKAEAGHFEKDKGNGYGYRYDETGDERGGPVAQEEDKRDGGEDESDEDRIADAVDTVADEAGLIVVGLKFNAGWKAFLQVGDFRGNGIGYGEGVAGGLPGDVEQDGALAVGGDDGVDRHNAGLDVGDVRDADGRAAGCGFDDDLR